jgi:hypothetical protein
MAMEYEIDDCDLLFDSSTNPSLLRRSKPAAEKPRLPRWVRAGTSRKAVAIPEEGDRPG